MTQERTQVQKDTIYLSNQRYDSVYVSHERTLDYRRSQVPMIGFRSDSESSSLSSADTIIIKDVSVEYRYRLLKDTVERVKLEVVRDSIPYPVEVEVIKEVSHTPWYARILAMIGLTSLGYVIIRVVIAAKRIVG